MITITVSITEDKLTPSVGSAENTVSVELSISSASSTEEVSQHVKDLAVRAYKGWTEL